jgi:hypothetical protein
LVTITTVTHPIVPTCCTSSLPSPNCPPLLDTTNGSGPHGISSYHTEWLPLNKIENLVIEELCYEDQAEFDSALCGSFADILTNLPHVTLKEQDGT